MKEVKTNSRVSRFRLTAELELDDHLVGGLQTTFRDEKSIPPLLFIAFLITSFWRESKVQ